MTQETFPDIHAATQALEQRIALTESEISQMQGVIGEKKQFIKGLRKAINAVRPDGGKTKTAAAN